MFLTVTPNLCIERTLEIPDFETGKVHRVSSGKLHVNAGGKGINAARMAAELGAEVLALSMVGKNQRAWFEEHLNMEGVAHELIVVEKDTRICTNILRGDGEKTEVVEAGAPLELSNGAKLLEKFNALLPRCELAAICGSFPPLASTQEGNSHLAGMSKLAQRHGKKLLVDSKGAEFDSLLKSENLPWAIKPNCDEAAAFLEYSVHDAASEMRALEDFLSLGIEVVLLSCGARGAYLGTRQSTHFFAPPRVKEISAVGSGDAFVGAFGAQYLRHGDVIEAARWGAAAGAVSASQKLSAFCSRAQIEVLVPQVKVVKIR